MLHVAHQAENAVNDTFLILKFHCMFQQIKSHCDQLISQFDQLSEERKQLLENISKYIQNKQKNGQTVNLVYICTHNSRRSHFGQVWAAVAAAYYEFNNVNTFSGGTEATAFHPNAIKALKTTGFDILKESEGINPPYKVKFGENQFTHCFSKVFDNKVNPKSNFAAIMTCSDAENNCPFIPGVELRIGSTYDDPKTFDGTALQDEKYLERSNQIALECLYVFSHVHYLQYDVALRNAE
jgi:arsenate reductase